MYAIVDIAGKQFKVVKDEYIYAPRLEGEAGTSLTFDKVLLVDNGGSIAVGAPTVAGASVSGKILEHVKGNKVIVFKKKRRKGYAVKNGHRQQFTKVLIEGILN
jgi:large subunit ribosomal protein L21